MENLLAISCHVGVGLQTSRRRGRTKIAPSARPLQELFGGRMPLTRRTKTLPLGSQRTSSRAPGGMVRSDRTVHSNTMLSPSIEISGMLPGRRSRVSDERAMLPRPLQFLSPAAGDMCTSNNGRGLRGKREPAGWVDTQKSGIFLALFSRKARQILPAVELHAWSTDFRTPGACTKGSRKSLNHLLIDGVVCETGVVQLSRVVFGDALAPTSAMPEELTSYSALA